MDIALIKRAYIPHTIIVTLLACLTSAYAICAPFFPVMINLTSEQTHGPIAIPMITRILTHPAFTVFAALLAVAGIILSLRAYRLINVGWPRIAFCLMCLINLLAFAQAVVSTLVSPAVLDMLKSTGR